MTAERRYFWAALVCAANTALAVLTGGAGFAAIAVIAAFAALEDWKRL